MTKECSLCLTYKSFSSFNKRVKSKDGLQFICKQCQSCKNHDIYIKQKDLNLVKDKTRNLFLKNLKKKLSRAIKNKSNCLKSKIGLNIEDLFERFKKNGLDPKDYGKIWGIKLNVFTNSENDLHYSNLIPFILKK